jgi:sugar phosphate isomerase/epimerase
MNNSRRKFIQNTAMVMAGSSLFSSRLFAAAPRTLITGIQLYTVRDEMKKDPLATLKALAAMGYVYVEHANYVNRKFYGYGAKDFKKILDDNGLKMRSGHTVMAKEHWVEAKRDFSDSWKNTIEDAAVVGQEYVISPWLDESVRKSLDSMKRYMFIFNSCGDLCRKSDMRFGYHNHNFEFTERLGYTRLYDLILGYTDPNLVIQQIDVGNLYGTGANAAELLQRYPGRFLSMHVKDEIKSTGKGEMNDGYDSTVIGAGIINAKNLVDLAKQSGTLHFIIEQESYQGKAPLDCAKEDLKVMKEWGY